MKIFFYQIPFFCNFKNSQKSIFELGKTAKNAVSRKIFFYYLFDFTSFWPDFFKFSGPLWNYSVYFSALCLPGYVSETGLSSTMNSEPCYPCPPGHFQEAAGQRGCLKCPQTNNSNSVLNSNLTKLKGLSSILQCPEIEKSVVDEEVRHSYLIFLKAFSFLHFWSFLCQNM